MNPFFNVTDISMAQRCTENLGKKIRLDFSKPLIILKLAQDFWNKNCTFAVAYQKQAEKPQNQ
jgi:hypothetical protein